MSILLFWSGYTGPIVWKARLPTGFCRMAGSQVSSLIGGFTQPRDPDVMASCKVRTEGAGLAAGRRSRGRLWRLQLSPAPSTRSLSLSLPPGCQEVNSPAPHTCLPRRFCPPQVHTWEQLSMGRSWDAK